MEVGSESTDTAQEQAVAQPSRMETEDPEALPPDSASPLDGLVWAETLRDMTGDSLDERLVLLARGDPADSLLMTLRIEEKGEALYADSFSVDRVIGFDAGRHVASDEEWESVLGYYRDFFAAERFDPIERFAERRFPPGYLVHIEIVRQARVRWMEARMIEAGWSEEAAKQRAPGEVGWDEQYDTAAALGHWERMVASGVPVFRYSPGGDASYSLSWSRELRQFFDLYPCC